jgi:hypothetical protein
VHLTDGELRNFDRLVLRIEDEARDRYLDQVHHLIDRLKAKIDEDSSFNVIKFLQVGSLRKGTALRPRDGIPVDADIAVYLEVDDGNPADVETLHEQLRKLVMSVYPNKAPEDFSVQPHTLGMEFHESGLLIDLVPVIAISGPGDYGWQPSSRGEAPVKTSVTKQLEFIRKHKQSDARYRGLVRLLKAWRNFQSLNDLRSFAIELIAAHVRNQQGPAADLESGLLRMFLWVAQTKLSQPVSFPENGNGVRFPADPVVVLDPVNSENNVARRITAQVRDDIVAKATETWELISTARRNAYAGETLDFWKQVFGRSFRIEE